MAKKTKGNVSRLLTEKTLSIIDAIELFPEDCKPSRMSIHRWIVKGVGGVQLEGVRIGHKWYTSHEAVHRFLKAKNAA